MNLNFFKMVIIDDKVWMWCINVDIVCGKLLWYEDYIFI